VRYYKWLDKNDRCNGGKFAWPLPKDGEPGDWVEVTGKMVACSPSALHACRVQDLGTWVSDGDLFEIEMDKPQVARGDDKVISQKARLLRRIPCSDKIKRLWACDMAEDVLPIFEREYPDDMRPRNAIQAGRDYADGKITAAARDAAWAAAWAAARAAAWGAAGDAAWDAAWAAAGAAAWAAAGAAAWDAAWDAAGAAAWAAARDAAGAAAWGAAGDAAKLRHGQMLLDALGEQ